MFGKGQKKMHFTVVFLLTGAAIILQHPLPFNACGTGNYPVTILLTNLNKRISTGSLAAIRGERAWFTVYLHGATLRLTLILRLRISVIILFMAEWLTARFILPFIKI